MESLIQTLLDEITEIHTVQSIVRYVPRFIAYASMLSVPGAEKRAVVLQGLHNLTLALKQADKISVDVQTELDQFIDLTVPPTIEAILDVAAGRVELKMPTTVAEVVPKINCILGIVQVILRIVQKPKAVKEEVKEAVVAEATPETI